MSRIYNRLLQDRALRDAALQLVKTDISVIRSEMSARSPGARLADRVSEGAMDMLDEAVDYAQDNPGKLAAGVGVIALWFARGPILRAAGLDEDDE